MTSIALRESSTSFCSDFSLSTRECSLFLKPSSILLRSFSPSSNPRRRIASNRSFCTACSCSRDCHSRSLANISHFCSVSASDFSSKSDSLTRKRSCTLAASSALSFLPASSSSLALATAACNADCCWRLLSSFCRTASCFCRSARSVTRVASSRSCSPRLIRLKVCCSSFSFACPRRIPASARSCRSLVCKAVRWNSDSRICNASPSACSSLRVVLVFAASRRHACSVCWQSVSRFFSCASSSSSCCRFV